MKRLVFSLAQLNLTIGDFSGNIALMASAAQKAAADGARIIVFSELSLTGAPPCGLLNESDFLARADEALADLRKASRATPELFWVVGAPIRRRNADKPENSLIVLRDGEIVLRDARPMVPENTAFDEHFRPEPGAIAMLEIDGTQVGFLFHEDIRDGHERACPQNPCGRTITDSPDIVMVPGAALSAIGGRETRHVRLADVSRSLKAPMAFTNQVGGHDQMVFDGASFVATPEVGVVFEAASFREEVVTLQLRDGVFLGKDGQSLPSVVEPSAMTLCRHQIVLGLQDYVRRCGFTKVVVGSSGGIDSALTLALAVEALGPERVVAITLPSRFSSAGSVGDSIALCRNLGIRLFEHPIHDLVAAFERGFSTAFGEPLRPLALENLQARTRGVALMEYANQFGALLLTTGNKSEISVGYCTLYGDTNGGLNLIGDLYKTEVLALSRHINEAAGYELIPRNIIEKPPSAELAPNQKDADSLPPYPVLDTILKALIEGDRMGAEERETVLADYARIAETRDGTALITRVRRMIRKSEFKRRQMPPALWLRARPFDPFRQTPLAAKRE